MDFKYIKLKEGDALAISYDNNEKELWNRILDKAELMRPQDPSWDEQFSENLKNFKDCFWTADYDRRDSDKETSLFFGNRMLNAGLLLYDLLLDNYLMNQEVTKRILDSQVKKKEDELKKLDAAKRYKETGNKILEDVISDKKYHDIEAGYDDDVTVITYVSDGNSNMKKTETSNEK